MIANYAYNQSGIRVRADSTVAVDGGAPVNQSTVFLLDTQNPTGYAQVLEELDAPGGVPAVSYTLGQEVLSQAQGGSVSHLLHDGHGSTRLLTDATGNVTDRYSYDAYGQMLGEKPGLLNPPESR